MIPLKKSIRDLKGAQRAACSQMGSVGIWKLNLPVPKTPKFLKNEYGDPSSEIRLGHLGYGETSSESYLCLFWLG